MARLSQFPAVSLLALALLTGGLFMSCTRRQNTSTSDAAATSGITPSTTTTSAAPVAEHDGSIGTPVQAQFRNVDLHLDADTVLQIKSLRGELVSLRRGEPPTFDDRGSFYIRLAAAEMVMAPSALANLMNHHVLAYEGAPLKDLEIGIERDQITMKGKVHKGIDLPFSMKATVSATPEGLIRLRATSFKTAKVPAKKLLDLFGVELDDLVKLRRDRGIEMKDDDVLLNPERLLPPPAVRGKVTDARVTPQGLRITFGSSAHSAALKLPIASARNYMYYRGGVLRFGKLTMEDADLLLLDADQRNPFDFDQDRYNDMLVAGYSKNTRQHGLIVHMPDYATVARTR